MQQNLAMLEQSRDIKDRYIAELDSLAERVDLDPRITTTKPLVFFSAYN